MADLPKCMTEKLMERRVVRPRWMEDALCREVGGDLWFLEDDEGRKAVDKKLKLICAECPVRIACLNHAITHNERYGIWGGESPTRRQRIRKKMQEAT